ncbi:CheR family methyltransferase [Undibacterium sp. SXout20W]|uniref:CheR family methyltransferase n=1 Tax=Undibacterium sp. SXout20W TaxID=3413051 RepID=UPI003BF00E2E
MEILIRQTENGRRICVLDNIQSDAEFQEFKTAIMAVGRQELLQVEFYDADHLRADILAVLRECADTRPSFKVVAYHSLLGQRLMRLNLPVQVVNVENGLRKNLKCEALVIAGSANSLDKILYIVEQLPSSDSSIFVLQHVLENQVNLLDTLLRTKTDYTVLMPHQMCRIEPATIYVAPPGHHMKVAHGFIYLTQDKKIQFSRPSIDVLLESVAFEYGTKATAVVLCGLGKDGVAGCAALKHAGGCVIVEDSTECMGATSMPDSIKQAGHHHYVFPHHVIASILSAYLVSDAHDINESKLNGFLHAIEVQFGFNFKNYHRGSIERRISNLMTRFDIPRFADFQLAVLSSNTLFERMLAEMSVAVTQFFRHPTQFMQLRQQVLPYLSSFPVIRIWSAGCATGEEAYSLAMLASELGIDKKCRIFATDINQHLLDIAATATYPLEELAIAQSNYSQTGGTAEFDNYIDVNSRYLSLKDNCKKLPTFHQHSLVNDGSFNEFQLIICRNVLIYFDTELQTKILQRFLLSLHRDGFLVLGPQDGLDVLARSVGFTPYIKGTTIYRRNNEKNND